MHPTSPAPTFTGLQKSRLRGLGQKLEPVARIGKQGIHPQLISHIRQTLEARGLVKVRFDDLKDQRKSLASKLADDTGACLVGMVGFTALLCLFDPAQQPSTHK